eukprot:TRINITY_DN2404_c0_g1_i1.p1 TRINITY_DN2404_c0_g1~~TRINITY_DN2404_c0_g1_i1.p1  ORF type:complete len:392 (+),score=56.62 TRINITY_DN2404_c0_g1_i1:47-1222(+)
MENKYKGCVLGMAVCDALGAVVEFQARGSYEEVTGMRSGGKFDLRPGEWTDDTSMALCMAESLLRNGFNADDQMCRYLNWYETGHMSSNGDAFDIGKCTVKALGLWRRATNDGEKLPSPETFYGPTTEEANGNGSLMRIAPIPLAYRHNLKQAIIFAEDSSKTTHGGKDAVKACAIYTEMIIAALENEDKETILTPTVSIQGELSDGLKAIVVDKSYKTKTRDEIRAGGWVLHALEAALWAFYSTECFKSGALLCVNLGEDTDTIAAIYGMLAGAYYGVEKIPSDWIATVAHRTILEEISTGLHGFSESGEIPSASLMPHAVQIREFERDTLALVKRIRPGPRMFRSYEDYRSAVDGLKKTHGDADKTPKSLFEDFVRVWERHDETMKQRF